MRDTPERHNMREIERPAPTFSHSPLTCPWEAVLPEIAAPEQALCDSLALALASAGTQPDQILLMQELERERQRIAMDLHDGLGPLLTLIKLELHNAKILMGVQWSDLDLSRAAIQRAEENVARAFEELRRAILDLRPAILDDLGIVPALRWLIGQFELSGTDVCIHSELMAEDGAVPPALKIVIFRICQESLNNAIKHARASNVAVELGITGAELQLSIEDDGIGMAVAAADILDPGSSGLVGIARRAHSSYGKLTVDSAAGRGTRLTIRWQLAPPPAAAPPETSSVDNPLASVI